MSWVLIAALVLVAAVFFVKFKETRHKIGSFLLVTFIILLAASVYYVYSTQNVNILTFDGLVKGVRLYFSWIGGMFHNAIDITGYAIGQDWGANSTRIAG